MKNRVYIATSYSDYKRLILKLNKKHEKVIATTFLIAQPIKGIKDNYRSEIVVTTRKRFLGIL